MKRFLAILLMVTLLVAVLPAAAFAEGKTTVYRVNAKSVNLRKGAGTSYGIITSLGKNTAFTVLKTSGKWYKVKVLKSGKTGWLYKSYTTKNAYAKVTTKHQGLNMRKGPGTGYAIIDSSPKGATVTVKYIQGNWAYVTHHKVSGWSSRTYLAWTK